MAKNVTLIVGGQYGSESKGKFAAYLSPEFDIAIRVGGPNAGHTVKLGSSEYKFRQLPVAALTNPDCVVCIGAAGLINLDVLDEEIKWVPNVKDRLIIDRNAGIIEPEDLAEERDNNSFGLIGSTAKGVGAALRRKISRQNFRTAAQIPELKQYIGNVQLYLYSNQNKQVMIEGTQGYSLSLDHGQYPFCTSRNVLASSLLSDVGLSPFCVKDIIMVIRTYPIRVFGNSGPMYAETDWETITKLSGSPEPLVERTTVTNRIRRVGHFDLNQVNQAIFANNPTQIALSFVDYLDYETNHGVKEYNKLSNNTRNTIELYESRFNTPITLIGTGADVGETIDMRSQKLGGLYDVGASVK